MVMYCKWLIIYLFFGSGSFGATR